MRVAVVFVVLAACAGCNPTVDFDVPVKGDTTVPAGSILEAVLNNFGFDSFTSMDLSSTQQFSANDTRKDQVQSTKLTKLTLSVTSPPSGNFDWLHKISFHASADGQSDTVVAHKDVTAGLRTFDCDNDNAELAAFVRAPKMSITTDVTAEHPDQDTTVHFEANFHVSAFVVGSQQ